MNKTIDRRKILFGLKFQKVQVHDSMDSLATNHRQAGRQTGIVTGSRKLRAHITSLKNKSETATRNEKNL